MLLIFMLACTKEPETKGDTDTIPETDTATDTAPPDTDTPTRPTDGFYGEVSVVGKEALGAGMNVQQAFGYADSGTVLVYLSSSPDADCESVTTYLSPGGKPYDPTALLPPETCDLYLKLTGWTGSFSATDDRLAMVYSVMTCGFGPGKFVYEERGKGDFDFYYTGRWWSGIPELFSLSLTETSSGFHLEGEMTGFDGTFIYEKLADVDLEGLVWGEVEIESCPAFKALL